MRLVRVVTSMRCPWPRAPCTRRSGRRPGFRPGGFQQTGSIRPVGRTTCSANTPPVVPFPNGPAWPRHTPSAGRMASHSSNLRGRLSMQEGSRKPNSARVRLAVKVAREHAADLRHGDMAIHRQTATALSGRYSNKVGGGSPGAAPGQVARIVLDARRRRRWPSIISRSNGRALFAAAGLPAAVPRCVDRQALSSSA